MAGASARAPQERRAAVAACRASVKDGRARQANARLMAAGLGGPCLQDEAPVAIGAIDGAFRFQIEENARMAERAASAVARDDRVVDLDDLWRIDGHGPSLILSGRAAPGFDRGGGAMIPIARRHSTGRCRPYRRHLPSFEPILEGIVLHLTHAQDKPAP